MEFGEQNDITRGDYHTARAGGGFGLTTNHEGNTIEVVQWVAAGRRLTGG